MTYWIYIDILILVLIVKNESTKQVRQKLCYLINIGWSVILWVKVHCDWRGTGVLYSELWAKCDMITLSKLDLLNSQYSLSI